MIVRGQSRGIVAVYALALGLSTLASTAAHAQVWPSRIVRLIVPYPAGGGADTIARLVGGKLSEKWGQQVLIENRGGAGGNLASEAAARSAPDGYTLYLAGEFQSTNIHLYPKLTYDPVADFAPVSLVVQYPTAFVLPNSSPARTVQDFIAYAKARPGEVTFASPGHGTGPHLAGELFKRSAGIQLTHVPYRGAAPALNDVIAGRVDPFFNNIAPVMPLMQQGQLRIAAVTTIKRTPAAPDIPTLAESGLPGFDVSGWYAFFVPARTPSEIVRKMHADTVAVLADPSSRDGWRSSGCLWSDLRPRSSAHLSKPKLAKWGPVIEEAGIKVE